jgi:hypothetical protein
MGSQQSSHHHPAIDQYLATLASLAAASPIPVAAHAEWRTTDLTNVLQHDFIQQWASPQKNELIDRLIMSPPSSNNTHTVDDIVQRKRMVWIDDNQVVVDWLKKSIRNTSTEPLHSNLMFKLVAILFRTHLALSHNPSISVKSPDFHDDEVNFCDSERKHARNQGT